MCEQFDEELLKKAKAVIEDLYYLLQVMQFAGAVMIFVYLGGWVYYWITGRYFEWLLF